MRQHAAAHQQPHAILVRQLVPEALHLGGLAHWDWRPRQGERLQCEAGQAAKTEPTTPGQLQVCTSKQGKLEPLPVAGTGTVTGRRHYGCSLYDQLEV
jgi:hypothetical protein